MRRDDLKDIFLNWKGLEFIHITKQIFRWVIGIVSLIFSFVTYSVVQNYFLFGISIVIFFMQLLAENKKEFYLKYKEIFNHANNSNDGKKFKDWLTFLESICGLNALQKKMFWIIYKKEFQKLIKKQGNK